MTDEKAAGETTESAGSADIGERFLSQVFEFWVNPEIERRRTAGTLPNGFELRGAQVIMNVGEPTIVRLNDEIRAFLLTKINKPVEKGQVAYWDDITSIEDIQLTDVDPNAGHVTVFRVGQGWAVLFDFRYNAERIRAVLEAADEFFSAAEAARSKRHRRAFMENLFAATELTAKGRLLMEPDERLLTSKKHGFIGSKMNRHAHLGNVDQEFVDLLNELTRERGTARYVEGAVALDDAAMARMASVVGLNLEQLKASAPKRFRRT